MKTPSTPDEFVIAILRGEPAPWRSSSSKTFADRLYETSSMHGVRSLFYHLLKGTPEWKDWPDDLRREFAHDAQVQAAAELIHKQELLPALEALSQAHVQPLLMKGTPLAYTLYPVASVRSRGDTDILVRERDRDTVAQVLKRLGYEHQQVAGGELASYQLSYTKQDRLGVWHSLDVHWKISNSQVFAQALGYEEADAEAVPVSALGEHARTLCPAHALLLALMHRVTHMHVPYYVGERVYYEGNRLVWLYDIHLLAGALTQAEWNYFAELARKKLLRAVCLDGLKATHKALRTKFPRDVIERLAAPGERELSAEYLKRGRWRQLITEFRALPDWKQRLQLFREHSLPPAEYMLVKYETENRTLLPWLYLRRALEGTAKLFNPPRSR